MTNCILRFGKDAAMNTPSSGEQLASCATSLLDLNSGKQWRGCEAMKPLPGKKQLASFTTSLLDLHSGKQWRGAHY
jgi:hypothetical protein